MPRWLAQRLPWGSGWSTVTTDAIDLHGGVGLTVMRPDPHIKPPEKAQDTQAAARDGDSDAQFRLAGRYFTGTGIERSVIDALRWYEAAATNGRAEAAYNLGTIYDHGLGTVSDENKAIEWYRRASDRGHMQAQERLRTLAPR